MATSYSGCVLELVITGMTKGTGEGGGDVAEGPSRDA